MPLKDQMVNTTSINRISLEISRVTLNNSLFVDWSLQITQVIASSPALAAYMKDQVT